MAKKQDEKDDEPAHDERKDTRAAVVDERAGADADGFTLLPDGTLLGPVGYRQRVVRGSYEHVAEHPDGGWIYRRM
jgi:hypothetical protein